MKKSLLLNLLLVVAMIVNAQEKFEVPEVPIAN